MTDLSRILVTGSGGMLGQNIDFGIKKSHKDLDITNKNKIEEVCNLITPSGILCLSSIDLRKCEEDPLNAYNVNVFGTYNLACEALKRKIPIIIISTGAVFNGAISKIFTEEDTPRPINIYGQTKYLAEILVREITKDHLIIRTGWLFGGVVENKSFTKFINLAINYAENEEEIIATKDQIGSPTLMSDFIEKLKELIQTDSRGTYNVVNKGFASAADVARKIVSLKKSSSKINAVNMQDLGRSNIKRSQSEALTSKKIKLRPWQEALSDYIKLKNNKT